MSVITMSNRSTRRAQNSTRGGAAPTIREADEFDGFWINIGTFREDGSFARLNRGIAVSDLQVRQIYETTDPQRKDELTITNAIVKAIQAKATAKKLGEGEFIVLKNMSIVLYRRMEGTEGETTAALDAEVEAMLFGDDGADDEDEVHSTKGAPKPQNPVAGKKSRLNLDDDNE